MARSLDELHEQTRKLNIRDTSSAEEFSSEDTTRECKCQQSSSTTQPAQCPRHPTPQHDAPSDKTDTAEEPTPEGSHVDPSCRCIECKIDRDQTEPEQPPGTESAPPDEGGATEEGKEKETDKEDGKEEEEERTLTLEELLEYREKQGLNPGDYLLEFGFGFPEEREVNLNVQIEGDFSVTVLM
ncbi:hypothetical protein P168DRAFT_59764 [Aspergillus campestris IBT 28561]|uniref:Uncharacterized protein n=1 Tax=Aspergillus campestris (strain IBT 28561) TaxID=1392248 RepID=A0A2I1CU76_ASPC2|nr:uncharacterized protein P168DRAFT_59764 [Aspergillus campestris IBT 28561]PKY01183.1 hypothetical protein P168DRAFT_59764 [Aspergillus campestris IBT 28561]